MKSNNGRITMSHVNDALANFAAGSNCAQAEILDELVNEK